MRYAVFGPREFKFLPYTNQKHVADCLRGIDDITEIIVGGGKGIEHLAEVYANENNVALQLIRPSFMTDTGAEITRQEAFDTRNLALIERADRIVVFWDGSFAGMVPIIQRCIAFKKTVFLYPMV